MDSKLRPPGVEFSRFLLAFRVAQHRIQDGFLFDHQYPERTIYSETIEVRVDIPSADSSAKSTVEYRWLSETQNLDDEHGWQPIVLKAGIFRLPFRKADTLTGELCLQAGPWPDATTETVNIDASHA